MAPLLHVYRSAHLHENIALERQAKALGFQLVESEVCFNIEASGPLVAEEDEKLQYLLQETFEPANCATTSFLLPEAVGGTILEVGPRQMFTSASSSNAVSICAQMGLTKVTRIEQSRRFLVQPAAQPQDLQQLAQLVHDRMTECVYPNGIESFEAHGEPEKWKQVPVMEHGRSALEALSKEKGLGYDEQDLEYYVRVFRDELKRDPTTVECFDLAQGNSEHSRHWFFWRAHGYRW